MTTTTRLRSARTVLFAVLALSTAPAADAPHPMVGTWTGTWTRGDTSELTITRVDDNGDVHGVYCHIFRKFHSLGVIELHPEKATAATFLGDTLRFELGTSHIEAVLNPENPEEVVFSNRRESNDANSVLSMKRIDAPACTAQYRAHTVAEVSGTGKSLAAHMPDHPDHALIGHWTELDRETDLTVELSIYAIEEGKAKGVFCNLWSVNAGYYYALDPTTGFQARTNAGSIQFDVGHIAFAFRLLNGSLQMTREANGHARTLTLVKTSTPSCAERFIPIPAEAARSGLGLAPNVPCQPPTPTLRVHRGSRGARPRDPYRRRREIQCAEPDPLLENLDATVVASEPTNLTGRDQAKAANDPARAQLGLF